MFELEDGTLLVVASNGDVGKVVANGKYAETVLVKITWKAPKSHRKVGQTYVWPANGKI